VRIFVALPLPDDIRLKLDRWLTPLRSRFPELRWVRPELIHLTIRFLGDVGQDEIAHIDQILSSNRLTGSEFTLDRSGTFTRGRERLPSVYWVSGKWSPGLFDIARLLSEVKDDRKMPKRTKRFNPHLTIARQGRYNEIVEIPAPGPWEGALNRIVVFNSTLLPTGPDYNEICSYRLEE